MLYNLKIHQYPDSTEFRLYNYTIHKNDDDNLNDDCSGAIDTNTEIGVIENTEEKEDIERSQYQIDHSLDVSMNRTKNKVMEYSRANAWEWFVTLTFNPDKVDSYDYNLCYKKVSKWFDNLKQRKCPDIKYLCVPEKHPTSGRWHFHALVSNIDIDKLKFTDSTKRTPSGDIIYNISGFKWGFTTATAVKDTKRVSTYISKYITKSLSGAVSSRHRYIASSNLDTAITRELYISPEDIERLQVDLIVRGGYFKSVKVRGESQVTYVNIDNDKLQSSDSDN